MSTIFDTYAAKFKQDPLEAAELLSQVITNTSTRPDVLLTIYIMGHIALNGTALNSSQQAQFTEVNPHYFAFMWQLYSNY